MNGDDLASALNRCGLGASNEVSADGVETVRVWRPGDGAMVAPHEISIENGVPFWPWGSPIRPATDDEREEDPDAIAARIDRFLGERVNFSVSRG